MSLDQIYSQILLEESRNPEHRRTLKEASHKEFGHNPSCGDEIGLEIKLEDGRLKDIAYTGQGCAISQASTSIMCGIVKDMEREEAIRLCDNFIAMIKGEDLTEEDKDQLEDAMLFENIKNMPARVKCAVLPWHTLRNVLNK